MNLDVNHNTFEIAIAKTILKGNILYVSFIMNKQGLFKKLRQRDMRAVSKSGCMLKHLGVVPCSP